MIEASPRYVPYLALLLTFTMAVVLLQRRHDLDVDDCANPAALFPAGDPVADTDGKAERRHKTYTHAVGEKGRWGEGSIPTAAGFRLEYLIMHSFKPRLVYHRPGRNLVSHVRSRSDAVERVADDGRDVAIHRVNIESSDRRDGRKVVAAYLLVYHGESVVNPYLAQFGAVPAEIVSGRRPMTLYLVHTRVAEARRAEAEEVTRRWLLERWRTHRTACALP